MITVVCTDRGQHSERKLGEWQGRGVVPWASPHDPAAELPYTGGPRRKVRFHCKTCGRDVQWRAETAQQRYDTLTANGMRTLDVSSL